MSDRRNWTTKELIIAVKNSINMSDCLRRLGLKIRQGNYRTVDKYIKKENIDNNHWISGKPSFKSKSSNKRTLEDILVKHSTYNSGTNLKKRLLDEGLLKNECNICGMGDEWQGKAIVHVLDHINGEHTDNRLSNLRLVCPNCNSQLTTHCGRNIKNKRIVYCCNDCGKELGKKRKSGLCIECYWKSKEVKSRVCLKCKKETSIGNKSGLCVKCSQEKRQNKNKPSKEQLEKDIELMSWVDIGKKYSVSYNCVRKWAKNYGIFKLREKKKEQYCKECGTLLHKNKSKTGLCSECYLKSIRKVPTPDVDELKKCYGKMTLRKIGEIYGVSHCVVRGWIKKYKLDNKDCNQ